ncbi:MAG: hypothetical protein Q8O76_01045, partial [Chloroflexota bacterium]|nr:hypothetical protein [Chloroflexota bacterium]
MRSIWLILVVVSLGISVSGDLLARRGEYGEWWYPVPGFFALLGLLGCIAIVVVSKLLGHYWLQRR